MNIRRLNIQDVISYRDIRLKALKENPENYSSSYEEEKEKSLGFFEDRLNQNHAVVLGAYINQKLVGIVTLLYETRNKTQHLADIVSMYVDSEHRKKGIAKALMEITIDIAKNNQKTEILRLAVTKTNKAAYNLYTSLGFIPYGEESNVIKIGKDYYDLVHMSLKL